MQPAVDIQSVSKHFKLYHEKYTSLKERVIHAGKIPYDEFWALRDVSAEVPAGQTMGILGRNGSGKSTLLKCVAGTLRPTSGQVAVRGHLAAMLELGAGMQPDLSGRDNVFLNGSLLGLSRREIERRFDDIVAFAELGQFIDNQVKFYSSGMYIRLGFAVAVNVEPDVLLVDEVLAVGDERFQRKCLDRVHQFQQEGRTIIVVSHSPDLLRQTCDQVLVLDRGNVATYGPPGEAIRVFREILMQSGEVAPEDLAFQQPENAMEGSSSANVTTLGTAGGRRPATFDEALLEYPGAGERSHLLPGEPLTVRVGFDVHEPLHDVVFGITITFKDGGAVAYTADTGAIGQIYDLRPGHGEIAFRIDRVALFDGDYEVAVRLQERGGGILYAFAEPAASFAVMNPTLAGGIVALQMDVELLAPGSALSGSQTA